MNLIKITLKILASFTVAIMHVGLGWMIASAVARASASDADLDLWGAELMLFIVLVLGCVMLLVSTINFMRMIWKPPALLEQGKLILEEGN